MNNSWLKVHFFLFIAIYSVQGQSDIAGQWHGSLSSPMGKIQLQLVIKLEPLAGQLSSSSGIRDMALNELKWNKGKIQFTLPAFGVSYTGKVQHDTLVGIWQQGPSEAELKFTRTKTAVKNRPQTPTKTNGYRAEAIQFQSKHDNSVLTGTLTTPAGNGPFPAVILLSVAGANDQDQTHSLGHKPFLVIADYLSSRGIAVLRYNDRGVGGSKGDLMQSDFSTFTHDALSAFKFLQNRKEIASNKIGYIGHSEGSVISAKCAIKEPEVAFTIMLGAVGVPLSTLSVDRLSRMKEMYQLSPLQKEEILTYYDQIQAIITSKKSKSAKQMALENLSAQNTFDKEGFPNHLFFLPTDKTERIRLYLSPWYKAQATYDPQGVLPFLKCSSLIINGSLDVFQHPSTNFPAIQKALLEAGNPDFTLMVAPEVNHVLQIANTGFPTEYAKLENTVSPLLLETIQEWITARYPSN